MIDGIDNVISTLFFNVRKVTLMQFPFKLLTNVISRIMDSVGIQLWKTLTGKPLSISWGSMPTHRGGSHLRGSTQWISNPIIILLCTFLICLRFSTGLNSDPILMWKVTPKPEISPRSVMMPLYFTVETTLFDIIYLCNNTDNCKRWW